MANIQSIESFDNFEIFSMTIAISQIQIKIIYNQAEQVYPEECCGILLGTIDGLKKTVVEVIPTVNVWLKPELVDNSLAPDEVLKTKNSRYTIEPQAIFKAQKRSRELKLNIIGFYHSHPNAPAVPSSCDRDRAWEVYSYPIVSVIEGRVNDFQSWILDSQGIFQSEEIM
jgi:proteasome lid subunit RPN8/RPN11